MTEHQESIFKEAKSNIHIMSQRGGPFHGTMQDPNKAAQYELLRRMASDLVAGGGFVQDVTVEPNDGSSPNVHVFVDFPDTVLFRTERKETIPAMMNAADSWTLSVRDGGGIRLTLTILNLWKE